MKNSNTFLIIVAVWFGLPLLFFFRGCLSGSDTKIETSTNEEIISRCKEWYSMDSCFLNKIGPAFIETRYKGYMRYGFDNPGGYHKLRTEDGSDIDSFPKIIEITREYFPDPHYSYYFTIWYNNGIVVFVAKWKLYNQNKEGIVLLYSSEDELLKRLPSYKIYKGEIPQDDYWLYMIDNNLYICSPEGYQLYDKLKI